MQLYILYIFDIMCFSYKVLCVVFMEQLKCSPSSLFCTVILAKTCPRIYLAPVVADVMSCQQ